MEPTQEQMSILDILPQPAIVEKKQWVNSQRSIQDKTEALRLIDQVACLIDSLPLDQAVDLLNAVRLRLHKASPFRDEPVDYVAWVASCTVYANDYNPNSVAPPEMELLAHSILTDGYTQPIVTMPTEKGREVVDGFHRNRVGKENDTVRQRVMGFLPAVSIKASQSGLNDRIAATIRHNRARGKHGVEAMSDIVVELKKRNWSDQRVAKELGMDPDEILRLTQVTGLAELFLNESFSAAWEAGGLDDESLDILSDELSDYEPKKTSRILHTWEKWECYRAGFYSERPPAGLTIQEGEEIYREFLADPEKFESALSSITQEWRHSCEHYLTNDRMNRIAWLGQAAAAYAVQMPSCCRGGYHLLTPEQQNQADELALTYLNKWLCSRGDSAITATEAFGRTEAELY